MDSVELAAGFALIEGNPTGFGATSDHGIDDFTVYMGHFLGEAFQVFGAERSEDFIDGGHGRVPPSLD
jgi:hypothetical protein